MDKPVKNTTLEAIKKIPAIQGELEFYDFLQQRFEQNSLQIITIIRSTEETVR